MRAVVRLGRIYAREGPGDIPAGLLRYGRGGMKLAPWLETVPLLQDHHEGKRIGRVIALDTFADVDGDWLVARCEVYPDAPPWVRKGCPASFASMLLRESTFVDGHVYSGYVKEVSLLLKEKPAEPGARVTLLYEPERPPAAVRAATVSAARHESEGELIPAPGRLLSRPGIGRVLGVR
jgi:hypothetical protein